MRSKISSSSFSRKKTTTVQLPFEAPLRQLWLRISTDIWPEQYLSKPLPHHITIFKCFCLYMFISIDCTTVIASGEAIISQNKTLQWVPIHSVLQVLNNLFWSTSKFGHSFHISETKVWAPRGPNDCCLCPLLQQGCSLERRNLQICLRH